MYFMAVKNNIQKKMVILKIGADQELLIAIFFSNYPIFSNQ